MTNEERTALAGEYVLGTLTAADREAVERMLAGDPELAAEVRRWEARLHPLASAAPSVEPPASVWVEVAGRIDGIASPPPVAAANENNLLELRRKVGIWRTATVAFGLLAAAIIAVFFLAPIRDANAPRDRYIAFVNQDGGLPPIVVDFDPATGIVTAQSLGADAPADRSYELWYIGAGRDPLSLGVLDDVGATIVVAAAEIVDFNPAGAVFAITDEPPGGAPEGIPTGPVLFQGELARATF
ncbi:MAG: anti-sigma factor [Bauldia sp.]